MARLRGIAGARMRRTGQGGAGRRWRWWTRLGGLFNAINVYMTATTSPEPDPVHPDDFTSTPKE